MVNPNSRIRLVKGDDLQQRPERIADLDMERALIMDRALSRLSCLKG